MITDKRAIKMSSVILRILGLKGAQCLQEQACFRVFMMPVRNLLQGRYKILSGVIALGKAPVFAAQKTVKM